MIVRNSVSPTRPTRVLFLAWGFSIHAKRRIQIFVDDPSFEVTVISTHNYSFDNATNVLLGGAQIEQGITECQSYQNESKIVKKEFGLSHSIFRRVNHRRKKLLNINTLLEASTILLSSNYFSVKKIRFKDFRLFKEILLSSEVRSEIATIVWDFRILEATVKQFKPDVIFLQTLIYPSYIALSLPLPVPIMITFWNGDVTWWAKWSEIEHLLKKHIVKYGVRRAQTITVNSKMALNACLEYGAEAEKIHLIRYPGVDLKRFKPFAKEEARKKLGIPFQKMILCPRGLGGYLNSDVIVESAARVIKRFPDTLFLFISGNEVEGEWKKHQQRAHELGIKKHFRWDGQVAWDLMAMYYSASDAMVSISSNDSLPNCMLEAMSCRVPLVMGNIASIREWIVDNVNGFLVPPRDPASLSDKILKVLENTGGNIESFLSKNLELVKREFDSEKNAQQIKELVHQTARHQDVSAPKNHVKS